MSRKGCHEGRGLHLRDLKRFQLIPMGFREQLQGSSCGTVSVPLHSQQYVHLGQTPESRSRRHRSSGWFCLGLYLYHQSPRRFHEQLRGVNMVNVSNIMTPTIGPSAPFARIRSASALAVSVRASRPLMFGLRCRLDLRGKGGSRCSLACILDLQRGCQIGTALKLVIWPR